MLRSNVSPTIFWFTTIAYVEYIDETFYFVTGWSRINILLVKLGERIDSKETPRSGASFNGLDAGNV